MYFDFLTDLEDLTDTAREEPASGDRAFGCDVARDIEEPWLEEARASFGGLTEISFRLPVV